MFSNLGGLFGANQLVTEGIIGADKVHYTKVGYERQGQLLTEAFLNSFENYKLEINK
jgi:hypothetical protein